MTTTKNKMTHHNGDQKKKHKKKVLLLALLLPLGFLAVAGATVCGLVAGKVFGHRDATKTPLSTVFGSSTINGNEMFMNGQNTPIPPSVVVNPESIWAKALEPKLVNTGYPKSVLNDITITPPTPWVLDGQSVNEVTVSAKPTSVEYDGFIKVTFVLLPGEHVLSNDLKTTSIDLTSLGSTYNNLRNVTDLQLFPAIKASGTGSDKNDQLDINAIKFQYDTTPSGPSPTWADWNWTNTSFGIGGTPQSEQQSLSLWDGIKYAHIRIAPNGWTYYKDSDPVDIKVQLYRPDLQTISDWSTFQATTLATFLVDPSSAQLKTEFKNVLSASSYTWKTNFTAYEANYYFSAPANNKAYLTYEGNPFYNRMDGGASNQYSEFKYALTTKQTIGPTGDILNNNQVGNLDGYFYDQPQQTDVKDAILNKCSTASDWLWSEFSYDLTTSGQVTISAIAGSLYYEGSRTITFSFKS